MPTSPTWLLFVNLTGDALVDPTLGIDVAYSTDMAPIALMTGGLGALPSWLGGAGFNLLTQLAGHGVWATLVYEQDAFVSADVAGAAAPLAGVLLRSGEHAFLSPTLAVPEPATRALWVVGLGCWWGCRGDSGRADPAPIQPVGQICTVKWAARATRSIWSSGAPGPWARGAAGYWAGC